MKKISVYSRPAIEAQAPPSEPHLIVSINCPGEDPANIQTNEHTLGRVNMFFWDMDAAPPPGSPSQVYASRAAGPAEPPRLIVIPSEIPQTDLFQRQDAKKIVDLVLAHPDAGHILVHCTAGKSRSAGCAAALHYFLNDSDEVIFLDKRYTPNMRVYRMIVEEWDSRQRPVEVDCGVHS